MFQLWGIEAELAELGPFEEPDLPGSFKQAVRRRGRPRKANPKVAVHIRFSPKAMAHFKAMGKGGQTRMDEALKEWIAVHGDGDRSKS